MPDKNMDCHEATPLRGANSDAAVSNLKYVRDCFTSFAMTKNKKRRVQFIAPFKAFTLAEVLITLVIIGVVAAITMTIIIPNIKKNELKNRFKTAYSFASQLMHNIHTSEGDYYSDNENDNYWVLFNLIKKHAVVVQTKKTTYSNYKNYNGTTSPYSRLMDGALHLANGMTFYTGLYPNYFIIDTNGYNKGPNRWGYDLFSFGINYKKGDYKVLVTGVWISGDSAQSLSKGYCTKVRSVDQRFNGGGCSYWALNDINPDDNSKKYWDSL